MKNILTPRELIIFLIIILQFNSAKAQWGYNTIFFDEVSYTTTSPVVKAVGIGDFLTAGAQVKAALNINSFYLPGAYNFASGNLLRTDGDKRVDNIWQMCTGTTGPSGPTGIEEVFRLFAPNNTTTFTLQATTGPMTFNTGGTTERMRILGTTDGNVLIGVTGSTGPTGTQCMKLEVGGNIDIKNPINSYFIDGPT